VAFEGEVASGGVNIVYSDCGISRASDELLASEAEVKIQDVPFGFFKGFHRLPRAQVPEDAGSISGASCTELSCILNFAAIDLAIMSFESAYLLASFEIPNDGCLIERTGDGLIAVIVVFDADYFALMFLQLIDGLSMFDVPYSGCAVE
jgi:hypothetical protein